MTSEERAESQPEGRRRETPGKTGEGEFYHVEVRPKELFDELGSVPKQIEGDRFEAKDRAKVPEKDKPTEAQEKAQGENIEKAREARRKCAPPRNRISSLDNERMRG